jgi:ribosomal protein S18 acetylase RimI-like enzyme
MIAIRLAVASDIPAICAFDQIALVEEERRQFIRESVEASAAWLAVQDDAVVGYAVLEYPRFFGCSGFISMLYIHAGYRRLGIGETLMHHLERQCRTAKLFSSTNASNLPMQALFAKIGYQRSGIVENLDEDDPELIYFKPLQPAS